MIFSHFAKLPFPRHVLAPARVQQRCVAIQVSSRGAWSRRAPLSLSLSLSHHRNSISRDAAAAVMLSTYTKVEDSLNGLNHQYHHATDTVTTADDAAPSVGLTVDHDVPLPTEVAATSLTPATAATVTKKAGTISPWAQFDNWGAPDNNDAHNKSLLEPWSVQIPVHNDDEQATVNVPPESDILKAYHEVLSNTSSVHFGYPYNLSFDYAELAPFLQFSINNLGDPFVPSNYGVHSRPFEVAVIDFFAQLWKMEPDSYWGYCTTSGTEGNLHGILLARERFPNGVLYTSQETHYSVFKAARYYRMECQAIPTLPMGEIDYDILAEAIAHNADRPVIMNVNIGTTVKGAVDNLDRILRIFQQLNIPRDNFYIHCDGALFALMLPFVEYAPEVSFQKPIDSIAVSGHKMLGCPMPCGVALSRKEHVKNLEQHIDYLNSVDTTIMGSRNGQAALYLWYNLRKKGVHGIQRDVMHCMDTARYLRDKLKAAGFVCRLNDLSSTVVFERPLDEQLVKRWQLACEDDVSHVVVMPNITRDKIDLFVDEMVQCQNKYGQIEPTRADSPLTKLESTW